MVFCGRRIGVRLLAKGALISGDSEVGARAAKRGHWADKHRMPPREWRRGRGRPGVCEHLFRALLFKSWGIALSFSDVSMKEFMIGPNTTPHGLKKK